MLYYPSQNFHLLIFWFADKSNNYGTLYQRDEKFTKGQLAQKQGNELFTGMGWNWAHAQTLKL